MSTPEMNLEDAPSRGAQHTRDRILDEAEALFAHKGFAGTSVRDIANRAQLTPASLYNHFSNKDALYRAVLERGIQPLMERLSVLATSEEDIDETGAHVIEGIMAHLAEHTHLPRLVALEAATGGEHLTELARDWIRPLTEQAIVAFKDESDAGSTWTAEEAPLAICAWMQMIFGHFSMAPLLAEVLGRDPLSKECLEDQTRFLIKLARSMSATGKASA